ncbi:MAG: phage virion morphogenesis protein [Candidatus Nanoarchaeia archaeon]|jgi:phage gpG-like protein
MVKRENKDGFKRIKAKFESELPDLCLRSMLIVESEAKRIVYLGHEAGHLKRQSGDLGRSITTESELKGRTVRTVTGTNLVYARIHELGDVRYEEGVNKYIPPRPYLTPAFVAKKDDVRDKLRTLVKNLIKEESL